MNEIMKTPEMLTMEINLIVDQTRKLVLSNSILIGQKLKEAKDMMEVSAYNEWLTNEIGFSKSTANNLLRIYEEYGADQSVLFGSAAKSDIVEQLSYTQAVMLLGVPAEEREAFIEKENVQEMSTRELKAKIAEMKAAKEAAEQETSVIRQNMATEMGKSNELERKLAAQNEVVKVLKSERDNIRSTMDNERGLLKAARDIAESKNQEIEILKEKIKSMEEQLAAPATVAVEKVEVVPDDVLNEIESLRKELDYKEKQLQQEQTVMRFKEKIKFLQDNINGLLEEIDECNDDELQSGLYSAMEKVLSASLQAVTE